jgi:hypothetical protein
MLNVIDCDEVENIRLEVTHVVLVPRKTEQIYCARDLLFSDSSLSIIMMMTTTMVVGRMR